MHRYDALLDKYKKLAITMIDFNKSRTI